MRLDGIELGLFRPVAAQQRPHVARSGVRALALRRQLGCVEVGLGLNVFFLLLRGGAVKVELLGGVECVQRQFGKEGVRRDQRRLIEGLSLQGEFVPVYEVYLARLYARDVGTLLLAQGQLEGRREVLVASLKANVGDLVGVVFLLGGFSVVGCLGLGPRALTLADALVANQFAHERGIPLCRLAVAGYAHFFRFRPTVDVVLVFF